MKLRNHTDHAASVQRATATFTVQPPLTDACRRVSHDEIGALDTQKIEIVADDTAPLDADMTAYAAFLTRLLTEGNEDDRL
jgi:hypothetical protein